MAKTDTEITDAIRATMATLNAQLDEAAEAGIEADIEVDIAGQQHVGKAKIDRVRVDATFYKAI